MAKRNTGRYLKQRGTRRLYPYTERLAERSDMVEVNHKGEMLQVKEELANASPDLVKEPKITTDVPIDRMNKGSLLSYAKAEGITGVDENMTKGDIKAVIKAKLSESDHAGEESEDDEPEESDDQGEKGKGEEAGDES